MSSSETIRTALVQTKPFKGRYAENIASGREAFAQLRDDRPALVVFPESAFTGYFLEGAVFDLALDAQSFADDLTSAWRSACGDAQVDVVSGFFENAGGTFYNSALYLRIENGAGRIVHVHRKLFLPTYGVFDEERFLSRGRDVVVFDSIAGRTALAVCEDAWHSVVPMMAALKGARLLIVPSASPGRGIDNGGSGELTSVTRWRSTLQIAAAEHGIFILYSGLAGFEGGKGMTGSSCAIDPWGNVLAQAPALGEAIVLADLDFRTVDLARAALPLLGDLRAVLPDLLLDAAWPMARNERNDVCAD